MAKNTYKQNTTPPSRNNEPRPARSTARPAEEPVREPRRNEAGPRPTTAKTATPKATKPPRRPLKLPTVSFTGLFGFLRDRRFQLFLGFFFLLSSIYLTIAFVSFVFTGHSDQSVVEGLSNTQVKEAGQESGNWLGLVGAILAQVLIYKGFGVAAFAVIPIVFFLGYKIVFRRQGVSLSYVLALCMFSMVWLSVLLGYVVLSLDAPDSDPALAHNLDFLSGSIGYETALWLDSLIGWGTVLLLAFLLISFVVFFFNVTSLNLHRSGGEDDEDFLASQDTYERTGLGVNHAANPTASLDDKEPEEEEAPLGMTLRRVGPVATPAAPARPEPQPQFEADDEDEEEFDENEDDDDNDAPVVTAGPVSKPAFSVAAATTAPVATTTVAAGAASVPLTVAPAAAAVTAAEIGRAHV